MVSTDPGSANLGPKVFFIWGSLCCLSVAFAYFLVPETKGLSLEQIDRMLEEVSPRKSLRWVPHSTFAAEMGLADHGDKVAPAVQEAPVNEKGTSEATGVESSAV